MWNAIASASELSALAGIGTGVAVSAFIFVLTRSEAARTSARRGDLERRALGELVLAALILAVASLEFALIAGETNAWLLRPEACAAFAGPTFSVGVMQLAAAICYLVIDFDQKTPTEGLPVSLASLCEGCYVVLATFCTFFSAWVGTDVLQLGFSGWPRPTGSWFGQPTALTVAAIVGVGLVSVFLGRGRLAAQIQSAAERDRPAWLSEWPAVGACSLLTAGPFALTLMLATDGSRFTQAGRWDWSSGVLAYVLGLVLAAVATICLWVTQGWIIHRHRTRPAEAVTGTNGCQDGLGPSHLWVVEGWIVYQHQVPPALIGTVADHSGPQHRPPNGQNGRGYGSEAAQKSTSPSRTPAVKASHPQRG